ncbi:MAG TPA: hypothetical protein VHH34_00405 [Pseudonocardiaceae bacterium]|nr:hypothetical protein [Pseudonocardiaceae bacterium]
MTVPFPGAAQVPDVPAGAEVEPAAAPLEGEIGTDEEYTRRALQRYVPPLADAADRGARPQDLRPGADAGTVVVTGEVEDIPKGQAFAIVRTHFVSTKDAYPVIDRAMAILHRAGRSVAREPEPAELADPAEVVDHLVDIAEVLSGERRVRTQVVLARLIEHNPGEYEAWDLVRLTAVLTEHNAPPIKAGVMYVEAERVALAIAERDRGEHSAR